MNLILSKTPNYNYFSVLARPMPEQCFSAKKKEPKEELEDKKSLPL
jgi:hypothetical protein